MRRALDEEAWNLATRRCQEALEIAIKALLSEMSVDYPKTHDPAPVLAQAIRARQAPCARSSVSVISRLVP